MKLFHRIAQWIFDVVSRRNWKVLVNPKVKTDLGLLHPGMDREQAYRDYYVGKLEKSMLIILAGTLLAAMLGVRARTDRRLDMENAIKRNGILENMQEVMVETVIDGSLEQFKIPVSARQLSDEEAEKLYGEFLQELPQMIAGKNTSLGEVRENLFLEESYEGYPFLVDWKTDDAEHVTSSGEVKAGEEAEEILLTAEVSYGELSWEEQLTVCVPAQEFTQGEEAYREMEKLLRGYEEHSRQEEYFTLPENFNGVKLTWSKVVEDYSLLLWMGAILTGCAIYFLKDKDLHDELGKRRAQMKREYPDIVHKLALYIGAGMTLRGAFQKIADEYGKRREDGIPEGPAYEEMIIACREMKSGVSEGVAYEHFGKRTGLQEYIRLSTLLTQNLKKGNNALLQRLREEADKACQERIQNSRKLGEEASTRLLVPMVMMLAVVMVMVMLPAMNSMGM